MNITITESLLFLALLVAFYVALKALADKSNLKESLNEVKAHNRTLYDLHCQTTNSALTLLDTLNKTNEWVKQIEDQNKKLMIEKLQATYQPK